jgi:hypothetical protein
MRTPLADNQIRDHMRLRGISRDEVIASMMAEQPARRFVEMTEVAGLITFLAGRREGTRFSDPTAALRQRRMISNQAAAGTATDPARGQGGSDDRV